MSIHTLESVPQPTVPLCVEFSSTPLASNPGACTDCYKYLNHKFFKQYDEQPQNCTLMDD